MKKKGNFLRSIVPFLVAVALQIAITIPVMIVYTIRSVIGNRQGGALFDTLASVSADQNFLQVVNIFYGAAALVIFGFWYYRVFVKPYARREKNYPSGFSFHTVCSVLFLGFGLQYVCTLIIDAVAGIFSDLLERYNQLMEQTGYTDLSLLLIVYSVILAPLVEELIFRGLIFRYARHAAPFWVANIWQALLFGVMHMNLIQGIYAFSVGLFLGWICHRGHGIKYSIAVHVVFNIFGCFYSDLFSVTTELHYVLFNGLGIALTAFAVWLFYTDFETEPEHTPRGMRYNDEDKPRAQKDAGDHTPRRRR